jgi:hypothetical protein
MTPQEQDMIGDLIDRVQKTQLSEKDPDAEQMLQQGFARTPDALYILAQTVLVQKYALDQAQTQLAQAKEQIEQMQQHPEPKHATSFLGNLLGLNREQQEPAPPPPQARPQDYAPPPPPPPYVPVGYGGNPAGPYAGGPGYGAPPMGMPGGGGFLQNAMQTAAGVAAGALAFEGIESLMHGFGHAAGYGAGSGLGGFGGAEQHPTETITNNYYDDNRGGQGDQGSHDVTSAERTLGDSENYSAKDDKDTSSGRDSLYGANDATTADSGSNLDDTSLDDGSLDDSGDNFDDSSSDDGGSDFGDGGGGDDSSFS